MRAAAGGARPWLRYVLLAALLAWAAGFAHFVQSVRAFAPAGVQTTDALVALTGDTGRISRAIALLEEKRASRLLITGAHPDATAAELAAAHGGSPALYACCVDVGRAASDTIGNAAEAAVWTRARGFRSVRLVTSDYHMPRSLLEFRLRLPEVMLAPEPVVSGAGLPKLAGEYSKYAARRAWLALGGER